jgi:hypothetical protein
MELAAIQVLGNRAKLLWATVLLQAIVDLQSKNDEERKEAERYLFSWGAEPELSRVCRLADVRMERVRELARRHVSERKRIWISRKLV